MDVTLAQILAGIILTSTLLPAKEELGFVSTFSEAKHNPDSKLDFCNFLCTCRVAVSHVPAESGCGWRQP